LAGVTVFLIPEGLTGQSAGGTTGEDGSFRLATRGRDGASPGDHKIIVGVVVPTDPSSAGEDLVKKEMMARQKRASRTPTIEASIPPIYSDAATTPLRCTVPVEGKLVLELRRNGP
jgi:hypothetical protein